MISLEDYLKDPCGNLSIPYWKHKTSVIPNNLKIVHNRDFSSNLLAEYEDDRYFAKFATVSGKIDNPANPERLYRKCGFVGNDVWHIIRKK